MPLPQPPVPLQDQCTVIYDNTLYAYQANAFQSLDLKEGGTWSQLSTGVSTNGSTCVQGCVDGQDSLIIVGGSGPSDYKGLQHYDFAAKQWHTIMPADAVASQRLRQGATFLQQTSEILMYGGSQDGNINPSTETFVMSTKSPYAVRAYESTAPPVTNPLLLQYNTTHALLLGGDPTNKALYLFGPDQGWQRINGTSLQSGLKDSHQVQATLLTGNDGGKLLELFDMSTTPNGISTIMLSNTNSSSTSASRRRSLTLPVYRSVKRQSDTSLSSRPTYNDTLAPQDSRTGFSLAQDSQSGLVVAAGGNQQVPVAIFNQTGNSWVDPNKFFGNEPTPSPTPSASATPAASSTYSTPPASSSAIAAANTQVRNKSLTILGGVLGGVFGAALLLVVILFLLRYFRKKRQRRETQRRSDYALEHKNEPMDFTDIGADFMKEAGGSTTMLPATHQFQNHQRNRSALSDRSVDPRTLDRGMTASSESKRALLHVKNNSAGSGKTFWSRGTKSPDDTRSPPQISAPILGPPLATNIGAVKPSFLTTNDPRVEPRSDAGWSRYFSNENPREVIPLGGIRVPQQPQQYAENRPQTYLSDSQAQSDYTSSRVASSHPHESAEVEPLSFHNSQAPPPIADRGMTFPDVSRADGLGLALTHGPSPERERDIEPATPTTLNGSVSNLTEDDDEIFHRQAAHVSHGESSGHDSWDPIGTSSSDPRESTWTEDRPFSGPARPSSSKIYAHPGQRVQIPDFPMPSSARNSAAPSPKVRSPNNEIQNPFDQRGLRNVISKDLARTGSGRQRAVEAPRTGLQRVIPGSSQGGAQAFPRPREQTGNRARGGSQTEDMSWLNLGTSAEQGNHNDFYFPGR